MPKFDPALPLHQLPGDIQGRFQTVAYEFMMDLFGGNISWLDEFFAEYSQDADHPNSLIEKPRKNHLISPLEKIVESKDGRSCPRVYPKRPGRYRLLYQMCFRDFIFKCLTDDSSIVRETDTTVRDYFLSPFDPVQPFHVLPSKIHDIIREHAGYLCKELEQNKVEYPVLLRKVDALHGYECYKSLGVRNPCWYSSLFNENSFERDRSSYSERKGHVPKIYRIGSSVARRSVVSVLKRINKGSDFLIRPDENTVVNWSTQYLLRELIFQQLTEGYLTIDDRFIPPNPVIENFFFESSDKDFLRPVDHFGRYKKEDGDMDNIPF